jgi:hypothetical protein
MRPQHDLLQRIQRLAQMNEQFVDPWIGVAHLRALESA